MRQCSLFLMAASCNNQVQEKPEPKTQVFPDGGLVK
jgi:hypothetical protein